VLLRRRDTHAAARTTAAAAATAASACLPIAYPPTFTAAAGFPWRLVNFVYGVFDLQVYIPTPNP